VDKISLINKMMELNVTSYTYTALQYDFFSRSVCTLNLKNDDKVII